MTMHHSEVVPDQKLYLTTARGFLGRVRVESVRAVDGTAFVCNLEGQSMRVPLAQLYLTAREAREMAKKFQKVLLTRRN